MSIDSAAIDYYPQEPADIALLHGLDNAQLRQSSTTIHWSQGLYPLCLHLPLQDPSRPTDPSYPIPHLILSELPLAPPSPLIQLIDFHSFTMS